MIAHPVVLVVDDEPDSFDVIEGLLHTFDYALHYAASGEQALKRLERLQPDLILLDVMMPALDGIETCRRLKAIQPTLPVIMVTALSSKGDLAACLEAGADDFITKPVNALELRARVQAMLRLRQQYLDVALLNHRLSDSNDTLEALNHALEAKVQARTAEIQYALLHDSLTGLASRFALLQHLEARLNTAQTGTLLYIDCDQFKLINNSLGYSIGDQLLGMMAERLRESAPEAALVARLGEDEFGITIGADYDPMVVTSAILQSLQAPYAVATYPIFLTVSIGLITFPFDGFDAYDLLRSADTAMYQAKAAGKGQYRLFEATMLAHTQARLDLEIGLRHAIEQQQLVPFYQPIVDLGRGEIVGWEALVRWRHPERGLVPPGVFIPCAEDTGLIVAIGRQVCEQACTQLHQWHAAGYPELTVSVNLSARQFSHPYLYEDITSIVARTAIPAATLKLEITETAFMQKGANQLIEQLAAAHLQISIDDFGTGYASFGYLERFPVGQLKIDRSFIQNIDSNSRNQKLVQAILTLTHALGIVVVAEGVETAAELATIRSLGCDLAQGYFFAKPLPAAEAEMLLDQSPRW